MDNIFDPEYSPDGILIYYMNKGALFAVDSKLGEY